MPNEEVILSKEKRDLFEALGIEGVVADILSRGGEGPSPAVKERSFWLRNKRKQLEDSANLKFWIPQVTAIIASIAAVIATTVAVFAVGGG